MICRCFVIISSVIRCCRCIFCNRSPLRRSSYDSTSLSPCSAILSASNSCTRHINDNSSRSVSESKRLGRFCKKLNKSKTIAESYFWEVALRFQELQPVVGLNPVHSLFWIWAQRTFPAHVRCNLGLTTLGACSIDHYLTSLYLYIELGTYTIYTYNFIIAHFGCY